MKRFFQTLGNGIFKIRYLLAIVIFALCVCFEISGSSVGIWDNLLPMGQEDTVEDGVIAGESRTIRSDEWDVYTPMALSQYYNYPEAFSEISNTLRGDETDVFIVYGQPVRSWKMIFRPFQISYLFLSPAKGLSFFWCGRLIALFMVSLELGLLLFKKKKLPALAYGLLIAFAPLVQWWFAINSLVEMLVFGQGAVLIAAAYMRQKSYLKKIILVIGMIWCGSSFALTLYPAWQIPILYIVLFLMLGLILRERRQICWTWKKDLPLILGGILVMGGLLALVLFQSWDTVKAVMSTVYPGASSFCGGLSLNEGAPWAVSWAADVIYPFHGEAVGAASVCETATVLCFFPMGIVLSLWLMLGRKKRDPVLVCLLLVSVFLTAYALLPWPEILAKVTLLSHCQGGRVYPIAGLANLLLLIYALQFCEFQARKLSAWLLCVLPAAGMVAWNILSLYEYFTIPEMMVILLITVVPFVAIYIGLRKGTQTPFLVTASVLVLVAGIPVNPLRSGLDVIYDQQVVKDLREVTEQDRQEAAAEEEETMPLWITESMSSLMSNVPVMVGAPTINSTNTYPDLERWALLDPEGDDEKTYNRYAHITIELQDEEKTSFTLNAADNFTVSLNVDDLETLGVERIFTSRDLSELETEEVSFRLRVGRDTYNIYDVVYADEEKAG